MGKALLTRAEAAAKWSHFQSDYALKARPSDRDVYLSCLPRWADEYVAGRWTLEQFEAHADAMREAMFGDDAERLRRSGKQSWLGDSVITARSPQP